MLFLFSLIIAVCLTGLLKKPLKKHPACFYWGAVIISLFLGFVDFPALPGWLESYGLDLFRRGTLATALWCVVMFAGALPNGRLTKTWMPLRGTLSIIAAILTLCHNIAYGRVYFVMLFQNPDAMTGIQILAAHLSMLMLLIMIPLTILSFPKIRKKLPPKRWKAIQRFAYLFYALLYLHVMVLLVPIAKMGRFDAQLNVIVYSIVFLSYAVCRIQKALGRQSHSDRIIGAVVIVLLMVIPVMLIRQSAAQEIGQTTAPFEAAPGQYIDGVYEGSAEGYDGIIKATVTVENGRIAKIEASSEESDLWFFEKAQPSIVADILQQQNTQVDTVSNATYSSKALIEAVQMALEEAEQSKKTD